MVRSDDTNIEYCCFLNGGYGWHIAEAIKKFRTPETVFYDIGANIGIFSLLSVAQRLPGQKAYSFEPVSSTRQRLQENAVLNGLERSIQIMPFGLGEREATHEVEMALTDCGRASLHYSTANGEASRRETIQIRVLDEIAQELDPPTLVKIDIEGHELQAIKGALRTLERHRPVMIVERNLEAAHEGGWRYSELTGALGALGYQFWHLGERRHETEEPHIRFPDILCLPTGGTQAYEKVLQSLDPGIVNAAEYVESD